MRALQAYQSTPAAQEEQQPKADVRGQLAAIWQTVLEKKQIEEEISFFEQGGSSLAALHVLSQYFNHGWQMTLSQFYEAPTIAEQAKRLAEGLEVSGDGPVQGTVHWEPCAKSADTAGGCGTRGEFCKSMPKRSCAGGKICSAHRRNRVSRRAPHSSSVRKKGERRVFCLIRGGGAARLKETLAWYFGNGWADARCSAIQVIEGDVGKENFGLTEQRLEALGAQIRLCAACGGGRSPLCGGARISGHELRGHGACHRFCGALWRAACAYFHHQRSGRAFAYRARACYLYRRGF